MPYLFRGALDTHARAINDEMKIACARALAALAREDVLDEVAMAYGRKLSFGRDSIIQTPFDPRLIYVILPAVAQAGIDTGAARRPIINMKAYAHSHKARMIFTKGDDSRVLRAAVAYQRAGLGKALAMRCAIWGLSLGPRSSGFRPSAIRCRNVPPRCT